MGKFTLQDDPVIEAAIELHLEMIKGCLAPLTHPKALFLYGSFGRGEGSVHKDGSGLHFFSDYEVGVISRSPLALWGIRRAERELASSIPVSISLSWFLPTRLHRNWSRNFSFSASPSIYIYELKTASQVFYGTFDLGLNAPDPRSLPVFEAHELLKNRMMEVIEKWFQKADAASLAFSVAKLILACGDVLLILHGLYHFSYLERARRFTGRFSTEFAGIYEEEFLPIYHKAVSFKLRPFQEYRPEAINAHLSDVKQICQRALRCLETAGENAPQPPRKSLYQDALLTVKCWNAGRKVHWEKIPTEGKALSLYHLLHRAITPLFFGLPVDGKSDPRMMEQAAFWGRWAMREWPTSASEFEHELVSSICFMWHTLG